MKEVEAFGWVRITGASGTSGVNVCFFFGISNCYKDVSS